MKFNQIIVIVLFSLFSQSIFAKFDLKKIGEIYRPGTMFRGETSKRLAREFRTKATRTVRGLGESGAHQGQAILMILLLTGVDIVKRQMEEADIKREDVDMGVILEHSGQAAEYIVQSGEIWSAITGAGITSTAFSVPMQMINTVIRDSKMLPFFKNLLTNGIGTLITFLGWELGAQLFDDARHLLEDDEDFERSERLMGVFVNALKGGETSREDWALIGKVFDNIGLILIHDHNLRNMFFYNTFRNRILTGEFITLVSSMIAASAVGSTVWPGGGTIGGVLFGLVGGVVWLFIPEGTKNSITHFMQSNVIRIMRSPINNPGVMNHVTETVHESLETDTEIPSGLVYWSYNHAEYYEVVITFFFEKFYRWETRLASLRANMEMAIEAGNEEVRRDLYDDYIDALRAYTRSANRLRDFMREEVALAESQLELAPNMSRYYDEEIPVVESFEYFVESRKLIGEFFLETLLPSIQLTMESDISRKEHMGILNRFKFFTFNKDAFYELLLTM